MPKENSLDLSSECWHCCASPPSGWTDSVTESWQSIFKPLTDLLFCVTRTFYKVSKEGTPCCIMALICFIPALLIDIVITFFVLIFLLIGLLIAIFLGFLALVLGILCFCCLLYQPTYNPAFNYCIYWVYCGSMFMPSRSCLNGGYTGGGGGCNDGGCDGGC